MSARSPNAPLRLLAQQTFSRVAGAPLIVGNQVELLIDARANFDAWLEAIAGARESILLENYMFSDDEVGRELRATLAERAAAGVTVRVIRDWFGCVGESRDGFWKPLRAAGGEVRTYNPFQLASPLGSLSRNHRKLLVVDATVGFISGVCVSARWLGNPARGIAPWRDTGVAVRGPATHELALAFAENWAQLGERLPHELSVLRHTLSPAGEVALRVVAALPRSSGLYRLDQLIAAIAQQTLWLTDAYFVGTPSYVQAICAAARDGVDVRLLVPGSSDVPIVGALSRAGYRPLLEAGVRVFEWNGSMLHAKTATADGRWARVGSTNLNVASWAANCEIDVAIENDVFTREMERQYEADLEGATEIILNARRPRRVRGERRRLRGSSGRAAAGAARLANTVGAVIGNRRMLETSERGILLGAALLLLVLAGAGLFWPRVLAWPGAFLSLWAALALTSRYLAARRRAKQAASVETAPLPAQKSAAS
ncbi:MAG: phospholipase D-like domain-containing protein [Deltaproteobacteria bacterium]